jgi:arylsulfatase A-like enzyme
MKEAMAGNTKKITLLCLFFIALGFFCCSLQKEENPRIVRIIDTLSSKNIIESPLKNLIQRFNFVEEYITGQWKYLPELSGEGQEIWGFSSRHSILGNHESEFPEGIKLLKNDKEIEYLSTSVKKKTGWKWIATEETLDLRGFTGYDNEKRGIPLNQGNFFRFEKLFPDGEVIIDLYVANPNWEKYRPRLIITFNDSVEKELIITRKKWFRFRQKTNLGRYTVEMKIEENSDPSDISDPVVLGMVKIGSSSDILLLFKPGGKSQEVPQDAFLFQYYTSDALPEKNKKAVSADINYYYGLRSKFPLEDAGTENNPYSLKKKIPFDEYALNSLIALPKSEFRMDMRIPPNAILEFGFGILNEFRKGISEIPIQFQILLTANAKEITLLKETIAWEKNKDIIHKKIDLKPYAGSKVKLTFLTTEAHAEDLERDSHPIVPVWVNPLIYQSSETKRPNIILISLDTVRPDHLGCYGYKRKVSPGIDSLATDSVLFKNAYSSTSWTLPAHVSMLTSLDCLHHQVYFPLQKMNREITTLADILRSEKYFCAAFTGGGYLSETYGFSKGFDSYQEIKLHGDLGIRFDEAERLGEMASDWIGKNRDKDFFLFLHTYQPHDPYANLSPIGKEFLKKNAKWEQIKMENLFEEKGRYETHFSEDEIQNIIDLYDGEIKYTDVAFVQPIFYKLRALGLYEKSLIILTSDHGEEFYEHEAWLHDHSVYDEGIRIPLIIKFPEQQYRGLQVENIARITDILPTILHFLEIKVSSKLFDGQSLLPILKGKEKKQRSYVSDLALRDFDFAPTVIAVNKDNFKLILHKKIVSPYIERISRDFNGSQIELYDIEIDPSETKNLASNITYRDLCFELLQKIDEMCQRAGQEKKQGDEITLDQNLRERLKALGYIN